VLNRVAFIVVVEVESALAAINMLLIRYVPGPQAASVSGKYIATP
jgi:hypothetical protein